MDLRIVLAFCSGMRLEPRFEREPCSSAGGSLGAARKAGVDGPERSLH
jgi:hypothetical protein